MKVIQARRERQDKISKLMGDYLLKGYKMLGECCDMCGVSEGSMSSFESKPYGGDGVVCNVCVCVFPDYSSSGQTAEKLLCRVSGVGL